MSQLFYPQLSLFTHKSLHYPIESVYGCFLNMRRRTMSQSSMFAFGFYGAVLLFALSFALLAIPRQTASDPDIEKALQQISQQRIFQTVESLVSFETRHSLSETASDERGVGAARRWIRNEFERYGRAGKGVLSISFDTFVAEPGRR
ncbi:MAG: hypothetical protein ACE5I2_15705, partial [Anaerolineae bacterium]